MPPHFHAVTCAHTHTHATLITCMDISVSMVSALLRACDMWERLTVGQPPSCWSSRNPILQSALSFFSQYSDESRTLLLHKTWHKHILLSDWGTTLQNVKLWTYSQGLHAFLHTLFLKRHAYILWSMCDWILPRKITDVMITLFITHFMSAYHVLPLSPLVV